MGATYKYNHGASRHLFYHLFVIVGVTIVVLVVVIGLLIHNASIKHPTVMGGATEVPQANQPSVLQVNEPLFTMQLPIDWKMTSSIDTSTMHSISWQSIAKDAAGRSLTIYIDTIPTTMPVNLELPVVVHGSQLAYGELSDNCSDFTVTGTTNVGQAEILPPVPSVWQGVNFICDIPEVINDQVGTGSVGSPVNTLTVTGPIGGKHSYFFLYTDLNPQPNYTILIDAIQSFQAK
jgi:hypothetical protein